MAFVKNRRNPTVGSTGFTNYSSSTLPSVTFSPAPQQAVTYLNTTGYRAPTPAPAPAPAPAPYYPPKSEVMERTIYQYGIQTPPNQRGPAPAPTPTAQGSQIDLTTGSLTNMPQIQTTATGEEKSPGLLWLILAGLALLSGG